MAGLNDLFDLSDSIPNAWRKIRPDLVSHCIIAFLIFAVIGVSLPAFSIPNINYQDLQKSNWYNLLKDSGFLLPIILAAILVIYSMILRTLSKAIRPFFQSFFQRPPSSKIYHSSSISFTISPILASIKSKDFTLADITLKIEELWYLFTTNNKSEYSNVSKNLYSEVRDAEIFLSNYILILITWICVFMSLSDANQWKMENVHYYWKVVFILFFLIFFARLNLLRAFNKQELTKISLLNVLLRIDPEMKNLVDLTDSNFLEEVQKRFEDLKEQYNKHKRPSIKTFILAKVNWELPKIKAGFPFTTTYEEGRRFSFRHSPDERKWLRKYLSFTYYSVYNYLKRKLRYFAFLTRFWIRGY